MLIGLVKLIILLLTGLGIVALARDFSLRDLRRVNSIKLLLYMLGFQKTTGFQFFSDNYQMGG